MALIVLSENALNSAMANLNFDNVNLGVIAIENPRGNSITLGDRTIPVISLTQIDELLGAEENFFRVICGFENDDDIYKMKKFLMSNGVSEDNIINFELESNISTAWLANLRHVEQFGAEFFATGINYTEVGLDLRYISRIGGG